MSPSVKAHKSVILPKLRTDAHFSNSLSPLEKITDVIKSRFCQIRIILSILMMLLATIYDVNENVYWI
ncbi:hypothetical protein VI01_09090 [Pantoea sp. SM3]|nr:hypothetical protein VI01_09090 [Pantoea sp. SM3]